MAKTLADGRIQVEAGDTLSGIYGANWQQLSGYTGDPKKLPIGTILPAKPSNNNGASLQNTLPPEKELPSTPTDNLSVFRNLLQQVSNRAAQESTANGISVAGFEPSQVSGGTLAGIVNFIKGQKTQGIADIYKNTVDFLDNSQKQAQEQLKMLVDNGAITELTDSALAKLASISGMDYDLLKGIQKKKQEETSKPSSFETITEGGQKIRVGFDKSGNIVSKTKIGESSSSSDKFMNLTNEQKTKIVEWMTQQNGFTPDDLKKMDEDPEFSNYMISKYFQENATE